MNCSSTLLHYHPRYLLSSIDISSKQYWLAVNNKHNIRLIDTLGNLLEIYITELIGIFIV